MYFVRQITRLTDVVVFGVTLCLINQPFFKSICLCNFPGWTGGQALVLKSDLWLLPCIYSFSFSKWLFGGQRNTFQFATIFVCGKTDFFSTFEVIVKFAVCLRTDNYYFRFLKLFNFGLMYNIGLGAIRAEGWSTRQLSFILQWSRGDIFQNKVSFTLIILFLYHHFRVGGHSNNSRTAPSPARYTQAKDGAMRFWFCWQVARQFSVS